MRFADRAAAGRALAARLQDYHSRLRALILGASTRRRRRRVRDRPELGLPLDVYVVRKLGVPGHEELAMGAITSDGTRILNDTVIAAFGITERVLASTAEREGRELERRERAYRGGRAEVDPAGARSSSSTTGSPRARR